MQCGQDRYENQVAFGNPDGTVVVVVHNDSGEEQRPRYRIDGRIIVPILPPDSFATLIVPPVK